MLMIQPARLKYLRESKALSRVDLSKLSGVNDRTIEALEVGRRVHAKHSTVRNLARALEVMPLDIASVECDA